MKVYISAYLDSDEDLQMISAHSTRQGAKNACYERELASAKQELKFPLPWEDATLPEKIKLVWNDDQHYSVIDVKKSVLTVLNLTYMVEEYEILP